jgi:hypothetical protein
LILIKTSVFPGEQSPMPNMNSPFVIRYGPRATKTCSRPVNKILTPYQFVSRCLDGTGVRKNDFFLK